MLALLPTQGQGAHLTLTENLLHGLMKLMQQAVERAEWDMTLELPKAPMLSDEVPETRILNGPGEEADGTARISLELNAPHGPRGTAPRQVQRQRVGGHH